MKQSRWHLTRMFVHEFYSDIYSPFNFHVVAGKKTHLTPRFTVSSPLFQIHSLWLRINTLLTERQCQLIGLHFCTFRRYISLLEWEDTPCFSSLYGLMEMRWSWPRTPPQWSTNNSLTSFLTKRKNVSSPPHCGFRHTRPWQAVTGNHIHYRWLLLKYLTLPLLISLTHNIQRRVYNYLSGECV